MGTGVGVAVGRAVGVEVGRAVGVEVAVDFGVGNTDDGAAVESPDEPWLLPIEGEAEGLLLAERPSACAACSSGCRSVSAVSKTRMMASGIRKRLK
jgi:hypothetical protein